MNLRFSFWLSILFGFFFSVVSVGQDLPLTLANGDTPLRQLINDDLQQSLEDHIKADKRLKKLIDQKLLAIGLVDLSDPDDVKFARINGNEMMYAASLPKIAVLLASMDALEKGEIQTTAEIKKDLRLMISNSNNKATTRMIDRLGYEKIENVLTSEKYNLYDEELGGGLWVGKRYAAGGATNREPIKNLSHAATATQVCRFYYLLVQGKLVSEARSREMLDIMENPYLKHKFVNTLGQVAPKARLFRKSGTWKHYHSDSILVWGPERRYILVGLVQDTGGEKLLRDLVRKVEKVLEI